MIIRIPLLAGGAALAGCRAGVVHTSALAISGHSGASGGTRSRSRSGRCSSGGLRYLDRSRRLGGYCAARSLSGSSGGGGGGRGGGVGRRDRRTAAVGASRRLEGGQDGIVGRLLLQVLIPRKGSAVSGEGGRPV